MTAAEKKAFVARMKKARKASNPSNAPKRKAKKSTAAKKGARNPSSNKHRPRRKNPTILTNPKNIAVNVVTALLSAVGTRQLPQIILAEKNTSWMGYLANAIAGAACTFAAHEFISPAAAQAAILGSGVIILDRVLTEQFSPIGAYLSLTGMGDPTAATKLGEISDGFYIHPTIFDSAGNPIIPHEFTDAAVRAFQNLPAQQPRQIAAPGAGSQLSGVRDRFHSAR